MRRFSNSRLKINASIGYSLMKPILTLSFDFPFCDLHRVLLWHIPCGRESHDQERYSGYSRLSLLLTFSLPRRSSRRTYVGIGWVAFENPKADRQQPFFEGSRSLGWVERKYITIERHTQMSRVEPSRRLLCQQDPEGNKTSRLRVEQPTKFELLINFKSAKQRLM
jgi:hypothetical protein